MSCECNEKKRNYYRYYDTPDGCDIDKKVMVTVRYGALGGLIMSTFDVMMFSHAVALGPMLRRFAFHMGHPALMGATFVLASTAAQRYRQKDDSFNYFLGGLACGPIFASYVGSKHAILLGGIGLGLIGIIKKDAIDNNWILFPQVNSHMGTVNGWRHDYTLVKDPLDGGNATHLRKENLLKHASYNFPWIMYLLRIIRYFTIYLLYHFRLLKIQIWLNSGCHLCFVDYYYWLAVQAVCSFYGYFILRLSDNWHWGSVVKYAPDHLYLETRNLCNYNYLFNHTTQPLLYSE